MITSKVTFSIAALACAWLGLTGCEGAWPVDAKTALEAAKDKPTTPATDTKPDPGKPVADGTTPDKEPPTKPDGTKPDGTTAPGCDKPLPPATPGDVTSCKVALDASGAECKVCFDASGKLIYDGCASKPEDGTSPPSPPIKCDASTDTATGSVCKTCWGADGKVVSSDCSPVGQPAPAPEKPVK